MRAIAEHPVLALLDVLAGDQRQQLGLLGHHRSKRFTLKNAQSCEGVNDQRVHEPVLGGAVIPVTGRLPDRGVGIMTGQDGPENRWHCTWAASSR